LKKVISIVKIVIVAASLFYIIYKIHQEWQNGILFNNFSNFSFLNFELLSLVILLMFVNWILEAFKFKFLLINIDKISVIKSLKAVFAGITASIFTPKRIGDFAGRIFFLQPQYRIQGTFATIIGSISQLIVTVTTGLFFLLVYNKYPAIKIIPVNTSAFIVTGVIAVVIVILYLNIYRAGYFINKISVLQKYSGFINFIKEYKTSDLLLYLFIGFLRYAVFTLQFYILLIIFGVNISYFTAITAIGVVYLVMTGIPTLALGELSIRGSVAVMIFEPLTQSLLGIIEASVLLWFINLVIPALIGVFFLSTIKKQ
jgi:uncharacterized membrane protein YbhN (UPF0104 family)